MQETRDLIDSAAFTIRADKQLWVEHGAMQQHELQRYNTSNDRNVISRQSSEPVMTLENLCAMLQQCLSGKAPTATQAEELRASVFNPFDEEGDTVISTQDEPKEWGYSDMELYLYAYDKVVRYLDQKQEETLVLGVLRGLRQFFVSKLLAKPAESRGYQEAAELLNKRCAALEEENETLRADIQRLEELNRSQNKKLGQANQLVIEKTNTILQLETQLQELTRDYDSRGVQLKIVSRNFVQQTQSLEDSLIKNKKLAQSAQRMRQQLEKTQDRYTACERLNQQLQRDQAEMAHNMESLKTSATHFESEAKRAIRLLEDFRLQSQLERTKLQNQLSDMRNNSYVDLDSKHLAPAARDFIKTMRSILAAPPEGFGLKKEELDGCVLFINRVLSKDSAEALIQEFTQHDPRVMLHKGIQSASQALSQEEQFQLFKARIKSEQVDKKSQKAARKSTSAEDPEFINQHLEQQVLELKEKLRAVETRKSLPPRLAPEPATRCSVDERLSEKHGVESMEQLPSVESSPSSDTIEADVEEPPSIPIEAPPEVLLEQSATVFGEEPPSEERPAGLEERLRMVLQRQNELLSEARSSSQVQSTESQAQSQQKLGPSVVESTQQPQQQPIQPNSTKGTQTEIIERSVKRIQTDVGQEQSSAHSTTKAYSTEFQSKQTQCDLQSAKPSKAVEERIRITRFFQFCDLQMVEYTPQEGVVVLTIEELRGKDREIEALSTQKKTYESQIDILCESLQNQPASVETQEIGVQTVAGRPASAGSVSVPGISQKLMTMSQSGPQPQFQVEFDPQIEDLTLKISSTNAEADQGMPPDALLSGPVKSEPQRVSTSFQLAQYVDQSKQHQKAGSVQKIPQDTKIHTVSRGIAWARPEDQLSVQEEDSNTEEIQTRPAYGVSVIHNKSPEDIMIERFDLYGMEDFVGVDMGVQTIGVIEIQPATQKQDDAQSFQIIIRSESKCTQTDAQLRQVSPPVTRSDTPGLESLVEEPLKNQTSTQPQQRTLFTSYRLSEHFQPFNERKGKDRAPAKPARVQTAEKKRQNSQSTTARPSLSSTGNDDDIQRLSITQSGNQQTNEQVAEALKLTAFPDSRPVTGPGSRSRKATQDGRRSHSQSQVAGRESFLMSIQTKTPDGQDETVRRVKEKIQRYFAPVLKAERVHEAESIRPDKAHIVQQNLASSLRYDEQKREALAESVFATARHNLMELLTRREQIAAANKKAVYDFRNTLSNNIRVQQKAALLSFDRYLAAQGKSRISRIQALPWYGPRPSVECLPEYGAVYPEAVFVASAAASLAHQFGPGGDPVVFMPALLRRGVAPERDLAVGSAAQANASELYGAARAALSRVRGVSFGGSLLAALPGEEVGWMRGSFSGEFLRDLGQGLFVLFSTAQVGSGPLYIGFPSGIRLKSRAWVEKTMALILVERLKATVQRVGFTAKEESAFLTSAAEIKPTGKCLAYLPGSLGRREATDLLSFTIQFARARYGSIHLARQMVLQLLAGCQFYAKESLAAHLFGQFFTRALPRDFLLTYLDILKALGTDLTREVPEDFLADFTAEFIAGFSEEKSYQLYCLIQRNYAGVEKEGGKVTVGSLIQAALCVYSVQRIQGLENARFVFEFLAEMARQGHSGAGPSPAEGRLGEAGFRQFVELLGLQLTHDGVAAYFAAYQVGAGMGWEDAKRFLVDIQAPRFLKINTQTLEGVVSTKLQGQLSVAKDVYQRAQELYDYVMLKELYRKPQIKGSRVQNPFGGPESEQNQREVERMQAIALLFHVIRQDLAVFDVKNATLNLQAVATELVRLLNASHGGVILLVVDQVVEVLKRLFGF